MPSFRLFICKCLLGTPRNNFWTPKFAVLAENEHEAQRIARKIVGGSDPVLQFVCDGPLGSVSVDEMCE